MAITVRNAEPAECGALSDLALRSKAHWGYDARFLDACRDELTVDASDIERLRVRVAEDAGAIVGFYALDERTPEAELSFFFVEPERIGAGIGRSLWRDCMATAAGDAVVRIRIESDPNASGFYLAMGAVRVGEVPSQSIPGRSLPLLSIDIVAAPRLLRP